MTDQLRAIAEAKAQIAFPVPELHMLKEIRKERRIGYVEGFIAGRTSVTREQIAAALAEPGAMGVQSHDLRQADRVLALLNGEAAVE